MLSLLLSLTLLILFILLLSFIFISLLYLLLSFDYVFKSRDLITEALKKVFKVFVFFFSANLCRNSKEISFLRSLFTESLSILSIFSIFEIVDVLIVNSELFMDVYDRLTVIGMPSSIFFNTTLSKNESLLSSMLHK